MSNAPGLFITPYPSNRRYWVGGTAVWDGTAGSKWSLTSGGPSGASVPDATTDVYLNPASGAVTVTRTGAGLCKTLDCTGFTGTLAGSGGTTISGSLILGSAMTRTYIGALTFNSATGRVFIQSNGISLASSITMNTAALYLYFQDSFTTSAGINVANGTLNYNNQTIVSTSIFTKGASGTVILGTSDATFSTWSATSGAGTLSAGSSILRITGSGFTGGGLTYGEVIFTNNSSTSVGISGVNVFDILRRANSSVAAGLSFSSNQTINSLFQVLGANSSSTRLFMTTSAGGFAPITITCNGSVILSNTDFQGIVAAGTAGTWSGTSLGDCQGNSNITFTTPVTRYHVAGGSVRSYGDPTYWSASSGGAGGASMPLVQDTIVTDSSSYTAGGGLSVNGYRIPTIDFTNATNNPTFNIGSSGTTYYGNLKLITGMTMTGAGSSSFQGYGITQTIDMGGVVYSGSLNSTLRNSGALTISSNLDLQTRSFTFNAATLNQGSSTLTCGTFTLGTNIAKTYNKAGDLILTGTGATVFDAGTTSTINDTAGTIKFTNVSASNKGFSASGKTFNNLWVATAGGAGVVLMQSGTNTFNDITIDPGAILTFQPGTITTNFNTLTMSGSLGNLCTLNGSVNNLVSLSGTTVNANFASITNSHASGAVFNATNSIDGGGNTTWTIFP